MISIVSAVRELEEFQYSAKKEGLALIGEVESEPLSRKNLPGLIEEIERRMRDAADSLDFELATALRDQLLELRGMSLEQARADGGGKKKKAPRPKAGGRKPKK